MIAVDPYLKRAWAAEEQARRARTAQERDALREIATLWRRLAGENGELPPPGPDAPPDGSHARK